MASQEKINTSITSSDRQCDYGVDEVRRSVFTYDKEKTKISDEILITESLITSCEQEIPSSKTKAKDANRNRKWIVLVAGFYVCICTEFVFVLTVLNVAFLMEFGRSKAETAVVQSLAMGMYSIAGVGIGTIVSKYGARKVGIAGGILASLGSFMSYFATSIPFLAVTLGMLTGLGLSACFIAVSTCLGEYFDGKARLLALSFISFGSGFGSIIYPYVLDFLTKEFGWRGCLLIISAQMMNMIPCFAICKPRTVGISNPKLIESERNDSRNGTLRKFCKLFKSKANNVNDRFSFLGIPIKSIIDTKSFKAILRNKAFILFTTSLLVALPAIGSFMIFIMNFLQMKDFNQEQALSLLVCLNIFSAIFKLSPGVFNLIPHFSAALIPALFTSIGAISCAILPFVTSYSHHIVMMGCLGIVRGGIGSCISVTTMKLVGGDLYSTAIGLLFTVIGISILSSGPIVGYLRDVSGSYDLVLFVSSGCLLFATCLCVMAATWRKWERSRSEKPFGETNSKEWINKQCQAA